MGLFSEGPLNRTAVNIHQVLERVRKIAQAGFGRHVEIGWPLNVFRRMLFKSLDGLLYLLGPGIVRRSQG